MLKFLSVLSFLVLALAADAQSGPVTDMIEKHDRAKEEFRKLEVEALTSDNPKSHSELAPVYVSSTNLYLYGSVVRAFISVMGDVEQNALKNTNMIVWTSANYVDPKDLSKEVLELKNNLETSGFDLLMEGFSDPPSTLYALTDEGDISHVVLIIKSDSGMQICDMEGDFNINDLMGLVTQDGGMKIPQLFDIEDYFGGGRN